MRRTRTTSERESRANDATLPMPTAIAALMVPKPSRMMIASASSSPGIDSSTSTMRIRMSSSDAADEPGDDADERAGTSPTATAMSAPESEWIAP